MQSISVNAASNALNLFGRGSRQYFGASFAGARSHFYIVLRDSLVTRAVSRSELAPYVQSRRSSYERQLTGQWKKAFTELQ